jgi:hypothetical protein
VDEGEVELRSGKELLLNKNEIKETKTEISI